MTVAAIAARVMPLMAMVLLASTTAWWWLPPVFPMVVIRYSPWADPALRAASILTRRTYPAMTDWSAMWLHSDRSGGRRLSVARLFERTEDWTTRQTCARLLGEVFPHESSPGELITIMVRHLSIDPDPAIRSMMAQGLLTDASAVVARALVRSMHDGDANVEREAARVWSSVVHDQVFVSSVEIATALVDPRDYVRAAAIRVIRGRHDAEAEAMLEMALADPSPDVRTEAAISIIGANSHQHTAALISCLRPEGDAGAFPALAALQGDDPTIVRPALAGVMRSMAPGRLRPMVARLLVAQGHPGDLPFLISLLADPDVVVRSVVSHGLDGHASGW